MCVAAHAQVCGGQHGRLYQPSTGGAGLVPPRRLPVRSPYQLVTPRKPLQDVSETWRPWQSERPLLRCLHVCREGHPAGQRANQAYRWHSIPGRQEAKEWRAHHQAPDNS